MKRNMVLGLLCALATVLWAKPLKQIRLKPNRVRTLLLPSLNTVA